MAVVIATAYGAPTFAGPKWGESQRSYAADRRSAIKGAMPHLFEVMRGRTAPLPEDFPELPLDHADDRRDISR